jgi:hypothetical protein
VVGVALALLALASTHPARALTLLPLDLAQLTSGAGRVFLGRVERVDTGRDANGLPAVWTTFAVDETLKGEARAHITLKHLGTTFGGAGGSVVPHAGIPRYLPGEAVVLFVHPESALGFTSPVGLGQGCFRVRDRDGRRVAENDVGNRNLAAEAGAARVQRGPAGAAIPTAEPLPLDTLLGRVRALVDAPP